MSSTAPAHAHDHDRPAVFVVIAAFNEESVIAGVVAELVKRGYATVVVDDGSRDDTAAQAHSAGATVLRHCVNRGQGAALQSGITYALRNGASIVVTFDGDGQHSPDDIPSMIEPIASGEVDYVLGSRFLGNTALVPRGRRLLLTAAKLFMRITSGAKLTDAHNGFRALSRAAASSIDLRLDRMAHASEIIDQLRRSGLPFKECPVNIRYTEYSLAKGQRAGSAFRVAFDYLIGRFFA